MQLPNEWLWDMIDEFMYQFQAYHQYRGKISQHTPEEKELLQKFEQGTEKVWPFTIGSQCSRPFSCATLIVSLPVNVLNKGNHVLAVDQVWSIVDVMNFLQAMVNKSGVQVELEQDGGTGLVRTDGFRPGKSNVLRVLGYFSLIGLLRLHALIGDYACALQVLSSFSIHEPRTLFARKIPGAFITLFYYVGFSYLMMRR